LISFLLCIFLLAEKCSIFQNSNCFTMFFSFSFYTLWCILMLFLEVHNMYMFRSIIHYKKTFCFCLLEVPHYGRKCLILFKNDVIFFSFQESHVWFGLQMKVFFGSQMTKTQPKWSIVWWIFHGFSGQKGLIPFWTIFYQNDHCGLGDLAFFNIIWCFTSQFA